MPDSKSGDYSKDNWGPSYWKKSHPLTGLWGNVWRSQRDRRGWHQDGIIALQLLLLSQVPEGEELKQDSSFKALKGPSW